MKNPESKSKAELIKENEVLQQKVKELVKTEEQFRIIAESTSDNIAITTFDLKAKYIYVSPSVKHVLGYDPKDLLGKSFFDFIHPDDKKVLLPLVKKYINLIIGKVLRIDDPKITETIEFRFKDKAGKWHYMQSTVNFIGKNLLAVTRDITERKQAQEEIINSEKKFRILTESAPIGIYYNDLNGTFLYGNKRAEEIIGYKQDELIGKNFLKLKLLNPKHILKAVKLLALNKLGKSTGPDNFTLNTKDGAQRQVEISTTIINIEGKEVVLGMVQDITGRKKMEEEILESEERYRGLSEAAFEAIFISEKGVCLEQNATAEKMFGYKLSEAIGRKGTEWIAPEDREMVMNNMLSGYEEPYEATALRKDGSTFRAEIQGRMMHFKGRTVRVTALRDITRHKQVEEEMQKLSAVVKHSSELIYLSNLDGRMIFQNESGGKILGIEPHEVENVNIMEIIPDHLIGLVEKELLPALMKGGTWEGDLQYRNMRTGELTDVHAITFTVTDPDTGEPQFLANVSLDITERKKVEEELAKHREHLEELVKKRTDEVEKSQKSLVLLLEDVNEINQELENVNTLLDATNKELEAFSYSVSHDLRAPLTRMDGFSKALIDSYSNKLDDKAVHFLNRIRASSQHMAKLIDDLLSLSRITSEKVSRQKVDLSRTAGKIAEELKASETGRKVNFEIAKGLSANADRKFVVIILENILGNAFKFTGKKENAVIEFGKKIIDENEVFFIKDNGAGFNMKYYDKIFTAFQRLHSDEEFKGSGIGLAIVQRIINKHGGKIWAESEVGKGATFYFRFE